MNSCVTTVVTCPTVSKSISQGEEYFFADKTALQNIPFSELNAEQMYSKYQYLVEKQIKKHNLWKCQKKDLLQEGGMALVQAIQKCDRSKGEASFVAYAKSCISGALKCFLPQVTYNVSLKGKGARPARRLAANKRALESAYQRRFDEPEVWTAFLVENQVSESEALDLISGSSFAVHLDECQDSEEGDAVSKIDMLHNNTLIDDNMMSEELADKAHDIFKNILESLSPHEQQLLKTVFSDEINQADIASQRGVSRAAVNQQVKRLLAKLAKSELLQKLRVIMAEKASLENSGVWQMG